MQEVQRLKLVRRGQAHKEQGREQDDWWLIDSLTCESALLGIIFALVCTLSVVDGIISFWGWEAESNESKSHQKGPAP